MTRIALSDKSGWFDRDRARVWEEGTRFDGSNHISLNTGTQWEHEELYRTAGGTWILCSWSQWQGSGAPTYERIDSEEAALWLIRNGRRLPDSLRGAAAAQEVA